MTNFNYPICQRGQYCRDNEKIMEFESQRELYWNYLINEKGQRPRGITLKRLAKIKAEILEDDNFWFQVINRFGAENDAMPSRFYQFDLPNVHHSRANFWAMVRENLKRG